MTRSEGLWQDLHSWTRIPFLLLKLGEKLTISEHFSGIHCRPWRPPFLIRQHHDELEIGAEITTGKAARLLREAEHPLAAGAAQYARCTLHLARHHLECASDADQHRRVQRAAVRRHPAILLRGTETNPDDIRIGGIQPRVDLLLLVAGQRTEGRRVMADDPGPGEIPAELLPEPQQRVFRGSVEEVSISTLFGQAEERRHQIGAADAVRTAITVPAQQPDEWHAVRRSQCRRAVDGLDIRCQLAFDQRMDIDGADILALRPADPTVYGGQSLIH